MAGRLRHIAQAAALTVVGALALGCRERQSQVAERPTVQLPPPDAPRAAFQLTGKLVNMPNLKYPAFQWDVRDSTGERLATVLALGEPAIVGDTEVVGLEPLRSNEPMLFRYQLRSGVTNRARAPSWVATEAFGVLPVVAPDARHVAYVLDLGQQRTQLVVRPWPDGPELVRSPLIWGAPPPLQAGVVRWYDHERFGWELPIQSAGDPALLRLSGNVTTPGLTIDTVLGVAGRPSASRVLVHPDSFVPVSGSTFALLRPAQFLGLAPHVRAALDSLGCWIPQSPDTPRPNNAIRGSFAKVGQIDWAVRCWRDHRSAVLIFWGGDARCPSPLREWSQDPLSRGQRFYDHYLSVADSARIANIEVYGPSEGESDTAWTPLREWRGYHGVEVVIAEKASTVLYCVDGRWIELGGGD